MNAGAREANGDVVLFLHADCSLPPDAARWMARVFADPGNVAGAFRIHTVNDGAPTRVAALLFLADVRSRYSRLPYGDQALFIRRDVFARLGGFPPLALMEDLELSRRLRSAGRLTVVPAVVQVSGRRFLARPLAYTLAVNVFPLLYKLGVPPRVLARIYGNPR
jgi:GT2 family glycosyltransferase